MSSLRVCKQIHHEALAAFYASSTFHFTDRQALHAFALAPHACVPRIRHITIARLDDHWSETLTPSLMGRLKSLRGIDATYLYPCCNGHAPFPHAQDVRWKNVWRMIRALRQHKLNAHVVRFDVLVYDYSKVDYVAKMNGSFDIEGVRLRAGEDGYEDLVRLEGGFKEALLRYTPRRLSRRGGGED
ncbi:hypothetical protein N0V94_002131 [Neodidymelliopsis sp. IMI 364377]|nr:hypothetical protein N0V94_002131 [Neodidymelliopsis sp. IMI 364377]